MPSFSLSSFRSRHSLPLLECSMARRSLARNCGGSAIFVLSASAFDGMAFGPPAQHSAGKVGNVAKPAFPQDGGGLRRAATGAAHRDDRPIARQFAGTRGQLAQRDQCRAANVPERAVELSRLADIEDLDLCGMLLDAERIDFPDSGEGAFERGPARIR